MLCPAFYDDYNVSKLIYTQISMFFLCLFWTADVSFDANTTREFLCDEWHFPVELCMKGTGLNCPLFVFPWLISSELNKFTEYILRVWKTLLLLDISASKTGLLVVCWVSNGLNFINKKQMSSSLLRDIICFNNCCF